MLAVAVARTVWVASELASAIRLRATLQHQGLTRCGVLIKPSVLNRNFLGCSTISSKSPSMRSFFAPPFRCIFSRNVDSLPFLHGNEARQQRRDDTNFTAPARRSDIVLRYCNCIHALDLGGGDGSVLGELRLVLGRGACGRNGGVDGPVHVHEFAHQLIETAALFCWKLLTTFCSTAMHFA